jgi:alpha-beta hydrolase superfamily lysophospholipase
MNDPLCFSTLQPKSTESFLAASARLADTDALSRIRPALPMYPFSGSEDPVGRQLGGVRTLIRRYRKARVPTISYDFYESGRREMLKELNRGEVRTNIMVWLSSVLHDQSRNREALWTR